MLYLIADRGSFPASDAAWVDAIGAVARSVAGRRDVALQLRWKPTHPGARAVVLASALGRTTAAGVRTYVNGTVDARTAGAAVHWPDAEIPPVERAPPLAQGLASLPPPDASCPRAAASIHDADGLARAVRAGASFAVLGPIFAPGCYPPGGLPPLARQSLARHSPGGLPPLARQSLARHSPGGLPPLARQSLASHSPGGLPPLARQSLASLPGVPLGLAALALARDAPIPVLALGGITPTRVGACLAAGARGVAASSFVFRDADPPGAARALLAALDTALDPARRNRS